jgi:hypothetical protein
MEWRRQVGSQYEGAQPGLRSPHAALVAVQGEIEIVEIEGTTVGHPALEVPPDELDRV